MLNRILKLFKPDEPKVNFKDIPLVFPIGEQMVIEFNEESVMMPEEKAREVMNDLIVYFNDRDVIKKPEDLERIFNPSEIYPVDEMPNLRNLLREWNNEKNKET